MVTLFGEVKWTNAEGWWEMCVQTAPVIVWHHAELHVQLLSSVCVDMKSR